MPFIFNIINGGSNGRDFIRRQKVASGALATVFFMLNFFTWNRVVGFRSDDYYCHLYAKNHKMLRNIMIQQ